MLARRSGLGFGRASGAAPRQKAAAAGRRGEFPLERVAAADEEVGAGLDRRAQVGQLAAEPDAGALADVGLQTPALILVVRQEDRTQAR